MSDIKEITDSGGEANASVVGTVSDPSDVENTNNEHSTRHEHEDLESVEEQHDCDVMSESDEDDASEYSYVISDDDEEEVYIPKPQLTVNRTSLGEAAAMAVSAGAKRKGEWNIGLNN